MTAPVPFARDVEEYLAGAVAGRKHVGEAPPDLDFYDATLGRIVRASTRGWSEGRLRLYTRVERLEGRVEVGLGVEGLAEMLAEIGDPTPEPTGRRAERLATCAPVTGEADVERLSDLARRRRAALAAAELYEAALAGGDLDKALAELVELVP
jgi:hypothetical protein